jgi:glutamine cyclotransferase
MMCYGCDVDGWYISTLDRSHWVSDGFQQLQPSEPADLQEKAEQIQHDCDHLEFEVVDTTVCETSALLLQ